MFQGLLLLFMFINGKISIRQIGVYMTHNIDTTQIHKRMNLYTIHTQKFKTDLIGVYIKRKLSSKEAAFNTLITRIVARGTKKYPSGKILQNKFAIHHLFLQYCFVWS